MALFFKAHMNTSHGEVKAILRILLYKENHAFIAYCPSLRLASSGYTIKEAKDEFYNVFSLYMDFYGVDHESLLKDLISNGWEIDDNGKLTSPSEEYMRENNNIYRNIIDNKKYEVIDVEIPLPKVA